MIQFDEHIIRFNHHVVMIGSKYILDMAPSL